jgi:hypothetical protein
MYEKTKNDFDVQQTGRRGQRGAALLLITIGVVFLLIQTGAIGDIGWFFGQIGEFFGNLGGQIGHFFGNLGGQIGRFFGTIGSQLVNLWPLILIAIGVLMLMRRPRHREE